MELVSYYAAEAAGLAEVVHGMYSAEYRPGPDFVEWRDGLWARHRARPEFQLVLARVADDVAGFAWAYIGARGQYWSDAVAASLPAPTADAWVGGHLEVVELIVLPHFRRAGIGRALLSALLGQTSADRALLSVRHSAGPARSLYRAMGWEQLGFLGEDMTVMGKALRGEATDL